MKIHLDYLEGRVEELENANLRLTNDKKSHAKKLQAVEDRCKALSDDRTRELDLAQGELAKLREKHESAERRLRDTIDKLQKELEAMKQ